MRTAETTASVQQNVKMAELFNSETLREFIAVNKGASRCVCVWCVFVCVVCVCARALVRQQMYASFTSAMCVRYYYYFFLVQSQCVDIAQFRSIVFRANVEPRKAKLVPWPLTCPQRSEILL